MRLSRKGFIALGLAAALFALPAAQGREHRAAEPTNRGRGLLLVDGSRRGGRPRRPDRGLQEQNPGIEFVNAAVAGGAGTNAQADAGQPSAAPTTRPTRTSATRARSWPATSRPARSRTSPTSTTSEGWKDMFPEGLLDADHGRRQDLLGAGQHPPVEPALVQPSRAAGAGASPPRRRPGRSSSRRPRRSKAKNVTALVDRPDLDPAAPARERAARRARRRQVHRPVGRHDRLEVGRGHRRARHVHARCSSYSDLELGGRRLAAGDRPGDRRRRRLQRDGRLGRHATSGSTRSSPGRPATTSSPSPGTDGRLQLPVRHRSPCPKGAPHRDAGRASG